MAVSALPVAMIELSFRASLMAVVGAAALPAARFEAAGLAAVTLSPVAVPADPEHRVTSDCRTNALPNREFPRLICRGLIEAAARQAQTGYEPYFPG
jgi:hypothetical protein